MPSDSIPQPAIAVVELSPAELQPDPRNPRDHKKRHIRQIANSIKAFGFNAPILMDSDKTIVAGHGRHAAAMLLGLQSVPTICLGHLSEQQRRGYLIADNRLASLSQWDSVKLAEIMLELADEDLSFDIEGIGFSVGEIDLMSPVDSSASSDEDALPEKGAAVTVAGDIWELGNHVILCASALDDPGYEFLMDRDRAHLVFTDPPYNVPIAGHVSGLGKVRHADFVQACGEMSEAEFIAFLNGAMHAVAAWSHDGSLHYWAMDWRHLHELTIAARAVYDHQLNLCVWTKTNAGMGSLYRSQHELFAIWRKGDAQHRNNVELGRFGRSRSNVWRYPGANSFGKGSDEGNLLSLHPTVKPVALIADAILDSTKRQDIVLDPFLGSGSTLIAAEKTGRRCRGIEIDPGYIDTIVRRWQRWTGDTALRRSDRASFNDLEAQAQS